MNFTNPWGFLALLGIPVIVVLYILKQKFKTHEVGSMALWNKILEQNDGNRWRQRLRRNLLMFLQILSVLLIALALSRPFISSVGEKENIIIVIDASLSMSAKDENGSRFEKAKKQAVDLIENSKEGTFFTVIGFDSSPYITTTLNQQKDGVKRGVKAIEQKNTSVDEEALKVMLKGLDANNSGSVYLFTDKNYDLGIEDLNTVIYGKESVNYAVKMLMPNQGKVLVKAASYGGGEKCTVALFADGIIVESEEVIFNENEVVDVIFDIDTEYKTLSAKIIEDDVLDGDNVYSYAGKTSALRKAVLISDGNVFIEKAIDASSKIELYKKGFSSAEDLSGYDIYIYDGKLPKNLPTDGHIWIFNPPQDNDFAMLSESRYVGKTWISEGEFKENILNLDFAADKIKTTSTPLWAQPLIESDEGTLAFFGEKQGQKICFFTFDLRDTQLPLLKEFPILVYNILNGFIPENSEQSKEIFAGTMTNIQLLPKTVSAFIRFPSLKEMPVHTIKGIDMEFDETGIYTLVQNFESGESEESYFAVNPVTTGESDLETGTQTKGESQKGGIKTGRNLAPFIILAAILLLGAEWWVNWREN